MRALIAPLARRVTEEWRLPSRARRERRKDRRGLPSKDPGSGAVIDACVDWLGVAQDHSASRDGGVARDFSLIAGWSTSYPETTGYIVPTILHRARALGDKALLAR